MTDSAKPRDAAVVIIHGFRVRAGLLRIPDRAIELDVSEQLLRRAISRRELAHVRLGDLIYISDQHLADWLARGEQKAAGE